jgi:hypothetical protein
MKKLSAAEQVKNNVGHKNNHDPDFFFDDYPSN